MTELQKSEGQRRGSKKASGEVTNSESALCPGAENEEPKYSTAVRPTTV